MNVSNNNDIERGKYTQVPPKGASTVKHSTCEMPTFTPKASVAGRLSTQIIPQKQSRIIPPGGQLFLCIIGSGLSLGICFWLAFFSNDVKWRRFLIASGAAVCAFMFAGLAISSMRKRDNVYEDTISPALLIAQRRATLTAQRNSHAVAVKESTPNEI
uniref:Uncharacterized protein n=1 Tax=Parastrongyloides trichosuri TaxID=131310 RepID=A0A0N5A3N2_PARTI